MITKIETILENFGVCINFSDIIEKYSELHRFYHIFPHVKFIIDKVNDMFIKGKINESERNILIVAAIFHDIIYDPQRTDNELQSAKYFSDHVELDTDQSNKVYEIILATRIHEKTGDKLIDIFCDLDMWNISNGSFIDILSNERKIFKEYQFVDYSTYKIERIKFLENVLKKEYGKKNENNIKLLIEWVRTQTISVGLYAGSFNPFHNGHYDILTKSQKIFDKVILAIGENPEKEVDELEIKRNIQYLKEKFNIEVCHYSGLLTSFIQSKQLVDNIDITLVRGLRDGFDLSYENKQIQFMKDIYPELKTVYIQSDRNLDHISSSAIRMLEKYDKELVNKYLP